MGVTLVWLFAYNIVGHDMNPALAFFKVLDGINELVIGMLYVVVIGLLIVTVFTLTNLFQTMTNLILYEYGGSDREHLKGEWKVFIVKMIHFNEQPKPVTPFPRYVSCIDGLYLPLYCFVVLSIVSECLHFAAGLQGSLRFLPREYEYYSDVCCRGSIYGSFDGIFSLSIWMTMPPLFLVFSLSLSYYWLLLCI